MEYNGVVIMNKLFFKIAFIQDDRKAVKAIRKRKLNSIPGTTSFTLHKTEVIEKQTNLKSKDRQMSLRRHGM